jgi:hypothetical protein
MSHWTDGLILSTKPSNTSTDRYSLKLNANDWAKVPILRAILGAAKGQEPVKGQPVAPWSARVTDQQTGQEYDLVGDGDDIIATPYHQPAAEDFYTTSVCIGLHPDDDSVEALRASLARVAVEAARGQQLLGAEGVKLDDFQYDHGWHVLQFSTSDAKVAEAHKFEDMLRGDAEDFQPTPWTLES